MNIQEVNTKLRTIPQLKGFEWNQNNYGTLNVPCRAFKDSGKNEYLLGGLYSIFIAHMYAGEPNKEFFYITMNRLSQRRNFRCRSFHNIEFNRRFVSGNTLDKVVNEFAALFTDTHDTYKFI